MIVRVLLCGMVFCVAGSAPAGESDSHQKRIWVDSDPETTERVFAMLETHLTSSDLDFTDTPLGEVVAFLPQEYGIEVTLDLVGLDDLGLGPDEPVTVDLSDVNLGVALAEMLRPLELGYTVSGGLLTITSQEEATHNRLATVVYPVRDMFGETPHYDDLIDVIVASIDSDIWAENGGGVSELRVAPFRGALIVTAPTQTQTRVFELLRALRESPLDREARTLEQLRSGSYDDDYEAEDEPTPADTDDTGGGVF